MREDLSRDIVAELKQHAAEMQGAEVDLKQIDISEAARMRVPASMPPPPGNREPPSGPISEKPVGPEGLQELPPRPAGTQKGEIRGILRRGRKP